MNTISRGFFANTTLPDWKSSLTTQEEVIKELRHLICRWEKQQGLLMNTDFYFHFNKDYRSPEARAKAFENEESCKTHFLELYSEIAFYIEWLRCNFGHELMNHNGTEACAGCASIVTRYTRLLITEMLGNKANINLLMPVQS